APLGGPGGEHTRRRAGDRHAGARRLPPDRPRCHPRVPGISSGAPARPGAPVIAARRPPPLPLARGRAPGRMADVDTSDLRLASEETSAFLADVIGVRLPGPLAAELHTRTEGWLAGVQLAGLALRRGVPPR